MVDINKAKKAFDEYVKNYNPKDPKIMLKINHIKRVANNSRDLANKLDLSKEDIELAQIIGLLHDIGRFEQIKVYNTFNDGKSVNHAQLGVKILFNDGLIRRFIEDNKYDDIIRKAIINHNKDKIEEGLSNQELLHAKIVRDSDKTDIFNVLNIEDVETCYETKDMSKEILTPEIYREFMEEHLIDYNNRKSAADLVVCHFAYVFDYNFKIGLKILDNKGYLDKLYEKFKFKDENTRKMLEEVYLTAKNYINEKIKE